MPQYEYGMVTGSIKFKPEIYALSHDQFDETIAKHVIPLVTTMSKAVKTQHGRGSEIVSHALTPLDGYLVVSLVFRREKPSGS